MDSSPLFRAHKNSIIFFRLMSARKRGAVRARKVEKVPNPSFNRIEEAALVFWRQLELGERLDDASRILLRDDILHDDTDESYGADAMHHVCSIPSFSQLVKIPEHVAALIRSEKVEKEQRKEAELENAEGKIDHDDNEHQDEQKLNANEKRALMTSHMTASSPVAKRQRGGRFDVVWQRKMLIPAQLIEVRSASSFRMGTYMRHHTDDDYMVCDMSFHSADERWRSFHPAAALRGGVSVPGTAADSQLRGVSVMNVWRALQVFDDAPADLSKLVSVGPAKILREPAKPPIGYRPGIDEASKQRLLCEADARRLIFFPLYRLQLMALGHLVDELRAAMRDGRRIMLLGDVESIQGCFDLSKPISHVALVRCLLTDSYPSRNFSDFVGQAAKAKKSLASFSSSNGDDDSSVSTLDNDNVDSDADAQPPLSEFA
jgi:Family of unknown function (DUF6939)